MSHSSNTVEKAKVPAENAETSVAPASTPISDAQNKEDLPAAGWLALSAIFVAAFVVRWIFNFAFEHTNNFASCDAFEYIQNAQLLLDMKNFNAAFWSAAWGCLTGHGAASDWTMVRNTLAPMKDFYISGPVFPAFLAITAVVGGLGSNIAQANQSITGIWPALITGNIFVSALTCVMIAATASESFGKKTGIVAGWLAVFYPAFIVNSGRLYSETFATCLLTAISYLAVRGFRKGGNSAPLIFVCGFLCAALQLARSIMVALSLVLLPLTVLQKYGQHKFEPKKLLKSFVWLLPLLLGFSLIAIPWLGFQKLAFGTGGLVVDRVGRYNFFIGNNIDIQGWLSYPYPDGRGVESRSFGDLAVSAVKKNPVRWTRLMLDKPLRLFKYPWNDFRTAIGPFTFHSQILYHQLLVLFGILGLACAAFTSLSQQISKREVFCRTFLFGLLAFHCVYFSFITVPRYNLSSIPEFIIFAAAAITLIAGMLKRTQWRGLGASIVLTALSLFVLEQIDCPSLIDSISQFANRWTFQMSWALAAFMRSACLLLLGAMVFLLIHKMQGHKSISKWISACSIIALLPLFVIPERANGRVGEWSEQISSGRSLKQTIYMDMKEANLLAGQSVFLLIDTQGVRQRADGLQVTVNGEQLPGPVLPSLCFAESFERFLETSPGHVEREGERMWSSLSYSADMANLDQRQWTMIRIPEGILTEAKKQASTSGHDQLWFDVELANNSVIPLQIFGNSILSSKEHMLPSVSDYSWEKAFYGVENPRGLTDTRYDIKVPLANRQVYDTDLSSTIGHQRGAYNVALLVSPPPVGVIANNTESAEDAHSTTKSALSSLSGLDAWVKVSSAKPASITLDLENSPSFSPTTEVSDQTLWIMSIKGKSKTIAADSGLAKVVVSFKYLKPDGTVFSYDPPWVPLRIGSGVGGVENDFEMAVPAKPIIDGAQVQDVTVSFSVQPKGPVYSNLARSADGITVEFSKLEMSILELPNNPLGLGLKAL